MDIKQKYEQHKRFQKMNIHIHGYRLEQTCFACPEQYDVFDCEDNQVAYFRPRHGRFYAAMPDHGGTIVYESHPEGDGIFEDDERVKELTNAILAVQKHLINKEWYNQEDVEEFIALGVDND